MTDHWFRCPDCGYSNRAEWAVRAHAYKVHGTSKFVHRVVPQGIEQGKCNLCQTFGHVKWFGDIFLDSKCAYDFGAAFREGVPVPPPEPQTCDREDHGKEALP
jgi:hypothetical protein